jgi:hypothetical protein
MATCPLIHYNRPEDDDGRQSTRKRARQGFLGRLDEPRQRIADGWAGHRLPRNAARIANGDSDRSGDSSFESRRQRNRQDQGLTMEPEEQVTEERERRRLKPAVGLGAAAVFFLALFAWSELRVHALREDLQLLSATNRQLLLKQQPVPAGDAAEQLAFIATANQVLPLTPTAAAGSAAAKIVRTADGRARIIFTSLPPLPSNGRYVIWAIGGEKRAPLASFVPAEGAATMVALEPLAPSDLVVTREERPVAHEPSTVVLFNLPLSASS